MRMTMAILAVFLVFAIPFFFIIGDIECAWYSSLALAAIWFCFKVEEWIENGKTKT